MYLVYRNRHALSWVPAVVIGGYLIFLSSVEILKVKAHYEDKAIEINLVEPLPEPTRPVVQSVAQPPIEQLQPLMADPETAIEEVKPKPKQKISVKKVEHQSAPIQPSLKSEPLKAEPKQVEKKSEPVKTDPVVQKPIETAKKIEAKPEMKATAPVSNASIEAMYLSKVRAAVEAQKRYPTGREASLERPEGSVQIWIEIDRSGKVLASGISNKANSMLLNRAASNSLNSIQNFSPFPADAYVGTNTKKFTATLNYQAP